MTICNIESVLFFFLLRSDEELLVCAGDGEGSEEDSEGDGIQDEPPLDGEEDPEQERAEQTQTTAKRKRAADTDSLSSMKKRLAEAKAAKKSTKNDTESQTVGKLCIVCSNRPMHVHGICFGASGSQFL